MEPRIKWCVLTWFFLLLTACHNDPPPVHEFEPEVYFYQYTVRRSITLQFSESSAVGFVIEAFGEPDSYGIILVPKSDANEERGFAVLDTFEVPQTNSWRATSIKTERFDVVRSDRYQATSSELEAYHIVNCDFFHQLPRLELYPPPVLLKGDRVLLLTDTSHDADFPFLLRTGFVSASNFGTPRASRREPTPMKYQLEYLSPPIPGSAVFSAANRKLAGLIANDGSMVPVEVPMLRVLKEQE